MFNRYSAHRFEDRTPKMFTPRVAPDPEVESKLNAKLATIRDRLQENLTVRRKPQACRVDQPEGRRVLELVGRTKDRVDSSSST